MRSILAGIAGASLFALSSGLLVGCAEYGGQDHMNGPPMREAQNQHGDWSRYDYNHPDPGYGGYEADRYYRDDATRYHERQMSRDERIYRGRDGRYYCRRSDGTTGLVVGAIAGGTMGNLIAPGGSEVLGTVLGAVAGGVAGRAIDRNQEAVCR